MPVLIPYVEGGRQPAQRYALFGLGAIASRSFFPCAHRGDLPVAGESNPQDKISVKPGLWITSKN
jgi:hypothetical protein